MVQVRKSFRKINIHEANDLMEIFEDAYEECNNKKEDYYRQIALIHLLVGYENNRNEYCKENMMINKWIYDLHPIIKQYRNKYKHGDI